MLADTLRAVHSTFLCMQSPQGLAPLALELCSQELPSGSKFPSECPQEGWGGRGLCPLEALPRVAAGADPMGIWNSQSLCACNWKATACGLHGALDARSTQLLIQLYQPFLLLLSMLLE